MKFLRGRHVFITRALRLCSSHASIGRQPMERSETQIVIDDLNQGEHALASPVRGPTDLIATLDH